MHPWGWKAEGNTYLFDEGPKENKKGKFKIILTYILLQAKCLVHCNSANKEVAYWYKWVTDSNF